MIFFVHFLLVILLSGCLNKKPIKNPRMQFAQEERLMDLPLPIGSKAYDLQNGKPCSEIAVLFDCWLSKDNLIDFYKSEMEIAGWQEISCINADESILIFQKPKKIACVTLRPSETDSHITVVLTCSPKKS
ncbi:hypothetical protein M1446_01065 [Candidatus Dependentiae bacterium]|nr:hypothetical protein [Candidatus Dependentiae bacterium]